VTEVILINVFTTRPERQDELLDQLVSFTDRTVSTLPGFVSATFHRSLQGTHVTNVARWSSRDAFLAFIRSPEAQGDVARCREIADRIDFDLYEVAATFAPAEPSRST
jgi:heme-degrading monooxygenase HmoA